jgi:hypothetical protein
MEPRIGLALLVLGAVALAPTPGAAQADTGRHRATAATEPEEPAAPRTDGAPRWFFAAGAGVLASGDLFRVRNATDAVTSWQAPGGTVFESRDFVVTLDEDLDLAVAAGRRLAGRTWLRLTLSTSRLGMTALSRVGQGAEVHRWDRLNVVLLGLDVEHRLVAAPHHPFLLAGGALLAVRGAADGSVDQTRPGARLGAGYHLRLNPVWAMRAEVRGSFVSLDLDDYEPQVPEGQPRPETYTTTTTPHHFWEVLVQMHATF